MTDNTNRAVGEIRHLLSKHNGNLGTTNSVAWMFEKRGHIVVEKASVDEETLMNTAIEAGADDFKDDGEHWEILTSPDMFNEIREAIVITGVQPVSAEIAMLPQNLVKVEGKAAQQIVKLMDVLEDQDDVQHVWSNFDIDLKEIEASLA